MSKRTVDSLLPPLGPVARSSASGAARRSRSKKGGPAPFFPTPERIEQEIGHVLNKQLSAALAHWVEGYSKVGKRTPYLWNWVRQAVEITTLPCVPEPWRAELCDTKTLGVLWDVLLDDVADRSGSGDLLEKLLRFAHDGSPADFSNVSLPEQEYAAYTCGVWREIERRASAFPLFAEYAELLRFDYRQLGNVMRYSHLLNGNKYLLNLVEHDLYTPHNMHIMICSTLDLMCSPAFDRSELGKLRELVWRTQCMGRIGNLVTTWQREIGENDFTSGVFPRAVMAGDLEVSDLRADNRELLETAIKLGGHEDHYLARWQRHRRSVLARGTSIRSFDVEQWVRGFERLFCLHLGSRGYK
jgi:hypothetical protein